MKILAMCTVILGIGASTAIAQTGLPAVGQCKHEEYFAGVTIDTFIQWSAGVATIEMRGEQFAGKVVGLRPFDSGFKFSIFYEDSITGPSEMVIFQIPGSDPPEYRMAIVGYEDLPDGERVASIVRGFEELACEVER